MRRIFLSVFLVTLSMNVFAGERPEIRKVKERLKELSSISSTHCDSMGEFMTSCKEDFKRQMKKTVRNINTALIYDYDNKAINKIHSDITEEKSVKHFRTFLTMHGVSYDMNENSASLKLKVESQKLSMVEMEKVLNLRDTLDSLSVAYLMEDDSIALQAKLDEHHASQVP